MRLSVDAGEVNVLSVRSAFTVLAHAAVSVLMTDRVAYVLLKSSDHTVSYHYFPEVHFSSYCYKQEASVGFYCCVENDKSVIIHSPSSRSNIDMYR